MAVSEQVEVHGPKETHWLDMNLMLLGGKEKKLSEFQHIFDAVGLELVQIWP